MLNEKIAKLLNTQINKEFYSAYLYLHFANFYVEQGLNGFANWYQIQAQEERDHALLMLQYLQNNDAKVALEAIAQPDAVLKENMDPLKAGLAHEQYVTGLIHTIYEAAYAARDFRTMQFLDWFKGAGRGGEKRRRFNQEDGTVRQREKGPLYARSRAGGPRLCRTQLDLVRIVCFSYRYIPLPEKM